MTRNKLCIRDAGGGGADYPHHITTGPPIFLDDAASLCIISISLVQSIDFQVAMMLIIIVVVFVVCHSIRSIVNSYEFIQYIMYGNLASWPDWIATLVHFRLVLLLHHIWPQCIYNSHYGNEAKRKTLPKPPLPYTANIYDQITIKLQPMVVPLLSFPGSSHW
jgi:hypothetical protein